MFRLLAASIVCASFLVLAPGTVSAQVGTGGVLGQDIKMVPLVVERAAHLFPWDDPDDVIDDLKEAAEDELASQVLTASLSPPPGHEYSHTKWYDTESGIDEVKELAWARACADVYYRKIPNPGGGGGEPGEVDPVVGG
jgi:hypothetical protein